MKYCKECLYPDSKPDLFFVDGICSACINFKNRKEIDWTLRKKEFTSILNKYKSQDGSNWDCIIPVSGGKDSTYQVYKILQLGYNPLCVLSTTCDLSTLGRENIDNLKSIGVDFIEFTANQKIRKQLNKIGLETVGDISWPEHISIFTIPVIMAVKFNIRLIIWGENSQNEYGGPASSVDNNVLDRNWLENFGGLIGLRQSDIVLLSDYKITEMNLIPYKYPLDEDIKRVGVSGLFLGYYFPWSGISNAIISQSIGFKTYNKFVEGSACNYENLDNYQVGIHDYFKYLKFGFGRATDIINNMIRRGILSREDGLEIVKRHDGKFPNSYLGKKLENILEDIGLTLDEFYYICDTFTNKNIFQTDSDYKLIKKDNKPILQNQGFQ
jgi:N-acetyl sugar amidotransferase